MFSAEYKCLSKYFTNSLLESYPQDHHFFKVDQCLGTRKEVFFSKLDEIFSAIQVEFGEQTCQEYAKKLIAKTSGKFNAHVYNSSFSEILVLYIMLGKFEGKIVDSEYEPTPTDSKMCSEFKFNLGDLVLNIEVKALDFSRSFDRVIERAAKEKRLIFKEYLPIDEKEICSINGKLKEEAGLDISEMVFCKSEISKVNYQIKNANKKFNSNEKYNLLFINYNAGIHPMEVIKIILDSKKGVLQNNTNMSNIDAVVLLSLSEKCYDLADINHAMSNAIVITNPLRNFKVKDFLQEIGFREFYSECDEFPEWDLYKIVVIHEIDQYVVVPYWKDNEEVIRDVMQFLA